jgi:acetate kinase
MLLSGKAESKKPNFHAQISRENTLLSEITSISSQREAIIRSGRLLADSKMPAPDAIWHQIFALQSKGPALDLI